jgi:replicative DNA helicase
MEAAWPRGGRMNALANIRPIRESLPNMEAEQGLLGAVLENNDVYHSVEGLLPEHFQEPLHGQIWAAAGEWIGKGVLVDPIRLRDRLAPLEAFVELGGIRYLMDMIAKAPPSAVATGYGAMIRDAWSRREIQRLGRHVVDLAANAPDLSADEIIVELERGASTIAHSGGGPSAWQTAGDIAASSLATAREQKGMVGLSTGLTDLDEAMGGLRKGQMIIIAARPAMGKSTAALQIAKAVASQRGGVCFFSMEMPPFDLGLRMTCDIATIRTRPATWPLEQPQLFRRGAIQDRCVPVERPRRCARGHPRLAAGVRRPAGPHRPDDAGRRPSAIPDMGEGGDRARLRDRRPPHDRQG